MACHYTVWGWEGGGRRIALAQITIILKAKALRLTPGFY